MKQTNIVGVKTLRRIDQRNFCGKTMKSISFSPNLKRFIRKNPQFTQVFLDSKDKIWYIGYKDNNGVWCGAKFLASLCKRTHITNRLENRTHQFLKCSAYFGRRMFSKWY